MEKFNSKGTKCPTLWLGTDKMVQNKAKDFVLELPTTRPDLDNNDFDKEGNRKEHTKENDQKSDIDSCQIVEKKQAIAQILASLIGLFYLFY
ncbi:MAG: hypothetical protein OHK0045_23300 [Raineya sp.]